MAEFMVERYLPGVTAEDLSEALARTRHAIGLLAEEGTTVRHLRCILVPTEESVFCLFEGPTAHSVEEANRRAEFPFDQVLKVVWVS